MRGGDVSSEARVVPSVRPLRPIRKIVDEVLGALTGEFEKLYAKDGRPSIPLEKLLCALLLQAFYSVRSERLLMEQLDYDLILEVFGWKQGDRRLSRDPSPWPRPRRLDVHADGYCLQPDSAAQAVVCHGLTVPGICSDMAITCDIDKQILSNRSSMHVIRLYLSQLHQLPRKR